jgi:hypothetical protein
MSTKVHDFAAQVQYVASIAPGEYTASETGATVDLIGADGRGFAALHVGGVAGGTTVAARLEHSADGSTWAVVTGASFPDVTAGPATYVLGFDRADRYVRAVADLSGGSPSADLCIAIGQQKKTI